MPSPGGGKFPIAFYFSPYEKETIIGWKRNENIEKAHKTREN